MRWHNEETLSSELALRGINKWEKDYAVVSSHIKVPFEQAGKLEELPIRAVINMRTDPDGGLRPIPAT
jgi:hypothetical protein